jgi:hypothetical protein
LAAAKDSTRNDFHSNHFPIALAGGLDGESHGVIRLALGIADFHPGISPYAVAAHGLGIGGLAEGSHN